MVNVYIFNVFPMGQTAFFGFCNRSGSITATSGAANDTFQITVNGLTSNAEWHVRGVASTQSDGKVYIVTTPDVAFHTLK